MSKQINLSKQQKASLMQIHSALIESKKQRTPRSRSRSRSRPRTPRLTTVAKKRSRSENKKTAVTVASAVAAMKPLKIQHSALSKKLEGVKKGYFSADSKDMKTDAVDIQKQIDALEREMTLVKATLRAGLGFKPIRARLVCDLALTATVTSGVVNTVNVGGSSTNRLQPSTTSEFSTFAALFDEYKMHGGAVKWIYNNTDGVNVDLSTAGSNNIPVLGYDPADGAAATASRNLAELGHHEICLNPYTAFSGGGVYHTMRFKVPPGPLYGSGGGVTTYGNVWVPTDITAINFGFLKFYHVGLVITATNVGAGFVYMDCEFRCRE